MLTDSLAFAGAATLLAMAPGPNTALIFRQMLRSGRPAAWAATAGIEGGLLFWALATAFGLSALIAASQVAYDVLRVAGALVLFGLGTQALVRAWRRPRAEDEVAAPPEPWQPAVPAVTWRSAYTGFVTTLANPKAAVFAISFLPQFVPAGAAARSTMLVLAAIWVIVDGVWYVALTWALGLAKSVFARSTVRRWLEGISGAVLIGLGVRLALEQHR